MVAVVEYLADAAACAFGDLACALRRSDADVLASDSRTFADVFRGPDGVKRDEIARAFADTLACSSGSLGGALADIAGSAANITAWAALLGWRGSLRLRRRWSRRVLRTLGKRAQAANGKG